MRNIEYVVLDEDKDIAFTPNGFATILAMLTRTGILTYQQIDPDGTIKIIRQLRLPDEVFSDQTMSTLAGIPLTNNHPKELINPANASDYIVGMASDNPKRVFAPITGDNEEYVQQRLTIFDASTIDLIRQKKKTQLSLGYSCELEFTPGQYKGKEYDAIQRNIRVNHAALVDTARGGPSCKVMLKDDGTTESVIFDGETVLEDSNDNNSKEIDVKVFNFDGKDYQVEDSIHSLLDSFQSKLSGEVDLSKAKQSEIEKLTAACDEYKAKMKVNNDSEDLEKFRSAVKSRVALESKGEKVLGSEVNLDSLSDREIKEQVIKKLRPATNLDDKTDDYVEARFEICVEDSAEEKKDNEAEKKIGKGIQNKDSDDVPESKKAQARAWEVAKNLWKEGVK